MCERGINGAKPVITDPRRVIDNLMNRSRRDHADKNNTCVYGK